MEKVWLSDKDLSERYGVHRVTVWGWVRDDSFPAPQKLAANTTRWHREDIEQHEARLREVA